MSKIARELKFAKRISIHTLRQSFATHMLEDRADIRGSRNDQKVTRAKLSSVSGFHPQVEMVLAARGKGIAVKQRRQSLPRSGRRFGVVGISE